MRLSPGPEGTEEEVCTRGREAVWSVGGVVRERFTLEAPARDFAWCQFEGDGAARWLCFLAADASGEPGVVLFSEEGEESFVRAASAAERLWGLGRSLLLAGPSGVWCLEGPMAEPEAVEWEGSGQRGGLGERSLFWAGGGLETPLAATYDTGARRHELWSIEQVSTPGDAMVPPRQQAVCLWKGSAGCSQASKAFISADESGKPLVLLLIKPMLLALRLSTRGGGKGGQEASRPAVSNAFTLNAMDAAAVVTGATWKPVPAGRASTDLLVLEGNGALAVYTGHHRLFSFTGADIRQDLDGPSGTVDLSNLSARVTEVGSGVGARCDVSFAGGAVWRVVFGLGPSTALVELAWSALQDTLPLSDFCRVYGQWLHLPGACSSSERSEWGSFLQALRAWLGCESAEEGGDEGDRGLSDWDFLLRHSEPEDALLFPSVSYSQAAPEGAAGSRPALTTRGTSQLGPSLSSVLAVLRALHSVYEDCRLDCSRWGHLSRLVEALVLLSWHCGEDGELHRRRYRRDLLSQAGVESEEGVPVSDAGGGIACDGVVADVYKQLLSVIQTGEADPRWTPALFEKHKDAPYDKLPPCTAWGVRVCRFYAIVGRGAARGPEPTARRRTSRELVECMAKSGWDRSDFERLPPGVSVPLMEVMHRCKAHPPARWPAAAYILLGRQDLAAACSTGGGAQQGTPDGSPLTAAQAGGSPLLHMPYTHTLWPETSAESDFTRVAENLEHGDSSVADKRGTTAIAEILEHDGMEGLEEGVYKLRFGKDKRIADLRRLLSSIIVQVVHIKSNQDPGDPELVAAQQAKLWQLGLRTMALPVGRGAFTYGTLKPLPTEHLEIPTLNLSGLLPHQNNATISLEFPNTGPMAEEITMWPEFHNGVAAGLRLASSQASLTRTWIVYNKPAAPSYSYAGMLMAFGLQGHLKCLAATDLYRYLSQEHNATTIGVLLGVAAAKCGSMDAMTSKMLFLHIPARHPASYPELELSTAVQTAALMGVGLLYMGSSHRLMTEILLEEIGRLPSMDSMQDREGYSLAAGLSLGLVNLGLGNSSAWLADMRVQDRLYQLLMGRTAQGSVVGAPGDAHRLVKPELQVPVEGLERGFDSVPAVPTWHPAAQQRAEAMSGATGSQVMESNVMNLDVTAPGATLALGLVYLKTNNAAVASRLAVPDTHYSLSFVRPDFIMLRVISASLIMWDSVEPSEEWVRGQLPELILNAVREDGSPSDSIADDVRNGQVDFESLAQAYVNTLTGACFAVGLKYAGTANQNAQELLQRYCLGFLKMKQKAPEVSMMGVMAHAHGVDKATLECCLGTVALALSVVMAGTGHLPTYRTLRSLRQRLGGGGAGNLTYGNHMAISTALGFLFMGGGTVSFSTDNKAIASLLISLFPRFPSSTLDNRSHLQALRHLYVLATEPRCVEAVDVDTWQSVYCPIKIRERGAGPRSTPDPGPGEAGPAPEDTSFTPCLLPQRGHVRSIEVLGPRYWEQTLDLMPGPLGSSRVSCEEFWKRPIIFVKRKIGMLPYPDDPNGSRSLLARAFDKGSTAAQAMELVGTFSSDPSLLGFANELCGAGTPPGEAGRGAWANATGAAAEELRVFCRSALYECVTQEKADLLPSYLALYLSLMTLGRLGGASRGYQSPEEGGLPPYVCAGSVLHMGAGSGPQLPLWSLKLAVEFYLTSECRQGEGFGGGEVELLSKPFVVALWTQVEALLVSLGVQGAFEKLGAEPEDDVRKDLLSGPSSSRPLRDVQALLLGFLANVHATPLSRSAQGPTPS